MSENRSVRRVRRSRKAARVNYDRLSGIYDLLTGWSEGPLRRAGLRLLDPTEGERILEIGFGTGASLVELVQATGPAGQVDGVDLSAGMHARALERLGRAGLASRVRLIRGDILDAPLEEAVYDAVFMSFTLELFDIPEIPVVLARCRWALRPGGRICVVSLSRAGGGAAVRLYEWAHDRFPVLLDCRPIFPALALERGGFKIRGTLHRRLFGLPVEIVLGVKES